MVEFLQRKHPPYAERILYDLDLNVNGIVQVGANSKIDLEGKGYITYYGAPEYTRINRYGGHGGVIAGGTIEDTQGHYDRASFAGMGGQWYGVYDDAQWRRFA